MNLPTPAPTRRPWSVRAIAWLLLGQAALFLTLTIWQATEAHEAVLAETALVNQLALLLHTLTLTAVFLLLLLTLLAFGRLWPRGWGYAMLVQGLSLALTLAQHFRGREAYTHPLMLLSIFMVIYLHHPDVQATFQVRPTQTDNGEEALLFAAELNPLPGDATSE